MGNTEFYRQTADLQKDFKWGEIFSEVTAPHTKVQKDKLLVSGCETYMPKEKDMLKEWNKPWLFARFGITGTLFVALMLLLVYFIASAYALYAMLLVVPAFVMPVTILLFFWEMNVPRNISLMDLLKWVMFAGAVSVTVTFVVRNIFLMGNDTAAWIAGPIPEEIAKFLMVYFIIRKKDSKYILNGLLIGCAVGVGFAAQESAGYALEYYIEVGFTKAQLVNVERGLLALGGHSVWASMYGAALVAAKEKEPLRMSHIGNGLVLITFFSAVLLHVVWNFNWVTVLVRFADLPVANSLYVVFEHYRGKYILLIAIAWFINFKLLRMGLKQVIDIGSKASAQKAVQGSYGGAAIPVMMAGTVSVMGISGIFAGRSFGLGREGRILFGREAGAAVCFPNETRGISGRHCEIKIKEGVPVLIDRESTYGTFLADGKKLEPNVPCRIYNGMKFYLAAKENQFEIKM